MASELPYASVQFDDDGLPQCAPSISDEAFCAGWASRYYTEWLDGNTQAPDWLWRFGEPTSVWYAPGLLRDDGVWCADSETDALAIFERGVGADAELYDSTDTTDPRWIDVIWDRTESTRRAFRVPRCTVFSQMADVGSLFESDSGVRTIDPLWTVTAIPADRSAFFDLARTLEVYRFASDDGDYDWSIPFAVGSHATDDLWTYRTCRIDTKADFGEDGTYDHRLLQVEYAMQPTVGTARYTIEIVRRVNCADPIWQAPDW
ncbi:MAG: hypothetical protein FJ102_00310 [Deltaproteobacteria bacterium]|nr:hypothetical protein [Deltaproteobacteria bacterium]